MRTLAAAVAALSLLIGVVGTATAQESRCTGYVEHLRRARMELQRGDRAGAIAALRRAKDALRACGQEDQSGRDSEPHAHSDPSVVG